MKLFCFKVVSATVRRFLKNVVNISLIRFEFVYNNKIVTALELFGEVINETEIFIDMDCPEKQYILQSTSGSIALKYSTPLFL